MPLTLSGGKGVKEEEGESAVAAAMRHSLPASFAPEARAASATNLRQCKKGIGDIFHIHETRQFVGRRRHLPLLQRPFSNLVPKAVGRSGDVLRKLPQNIDSLIGCKHDFGGSEHLSPDKLSM